MQGWKRRPGGIWTPEQSQPGRPQGEMATGHFLTSASWSERAWGLGVGLGPQVRRGRAQGFLGVKVRMQREKVGTRDPRTEAIPQRCSPAVDPGQVQLGVGSGSKCDVS